MNRILICVAVYDTEENDRTKYTKATYESLKDTVDFLTTDIVFIDNASCKETKLFLQQHTDERIHLITSNKNIGTAEAINLGIRDYSTPETFVVKLDNDVVFNEDKWADTMASIITIAPEIGVLGLKRKDLPNEPSSKEYPTEMVYLNHHLGDVWDHRNVIEYCDDIIGTCTMFNPELLKKTGYLWQPAQYAFDDTLMSARAKVAGFKNAFYPWIEIDHIDEGATSYTEWKRKVAGIYLSSIDKIIKEYISGERSIYYNPFE